MKFGLTEIFVALISAAATLGVAWINKKYGPNRKLPNEKNPEQRLYNHTLFSQLDAWGKSVPYKIRVESPLKRALLYAFLKLEFRVFKDNFYKLVDSFYKKEIKNVTVFRDVFQQTIHDYTKSAEDMGIPQIFITSFFLWHQKHIDFNFEIINYILGTNIYEDDEEIIHALLDSLLISFRMSFQDGVETLNALNGSLEKALYDLYKVDSIRFNIDKELKIEIDSYISSLLS